MNDRSQFTVVFEGDISSLPFNPMKANDTPFGRVLASGYGNAFAERAGRIAETFNEYGTPVVLYRCAGCGGTFTICPAPELKDDDQWQGCLGAECSSYDESRDGDKLFDAGKVRRTGDRSDFRIVPLEDS